MRRECLNLPLVALPGPLDAVLEEVCGELGALLLVVVRIGAKLVGIALRSNLEFAVAALGAGLGGHGGVQVAVVLLLAGTTSSSRPLRAGWRRTPRAIAA